MAQVLLRLQQLLSDVNSGLDDIAGLIRLDSAMTTRVIQISNSAWFGRGGGVRTIEEAVNRVGFREVYHLVSVAASSALVAQSLTVYGRDAVMTWKESIACAFAAESLAERLGEDTAIAYMNGLLHAIGRLAFNTHLPTIAGDPTRTLADHGFPADHSAAEFAVAGFTQADVGACMLVKWGFPRENSEPIRHQYEPLAAEVPHDRTSAVLYCARFLRTAVCFGLRPENDAGLADVLQSLPLSQEELLECLPIVNAKVTRAMQMMAG
jgi:HD-like signal output (HDOD) protein